MKRGITLPELAQEVDRQRKVKIDYTATGRNLTIFAPSPGVSPLFRVGDEEDMALLDLAETQLAERLRIPMTYWSRLKKEQPSLLQTSVNEILSQENKSHFVRTLDNKVRAVLSDRYRTIDNVEIFNHVLPAILTNPDFIVDSCQITETRLYLKLLFPKTQAEVRVGDVVQSGILLVNSEVGKGTVQISPLVHILRCLNGLVMHDASIRQIHLGGSNSGGLEAVSKWFKTQTQELTDMALLHQMRDVIEALVKPESFEQVVASLRGTTERGITGNVKDVSMAVYKQVGLSDNEKESAFDFLLRDGDYTQWGLSNSITRLAQDVESYDRSIDLERVGSSVLSISPTSWNALN